MTSAAVKITRKGQVTIPKEIRERLKTNTVYFEIEGDTVIVKPVRDAAGSLSEYAKNVKPGTPMKKIKEMAWEEAVREKTRKKSS
ncbi:MAG: AbrB/MazE/SpoVT family DNA-binding domain-containing protein [Nitrospirae bacterium]|jgi:AbrB family looped-hinge helix DNA binding protein|nr:AbrB/MazE/SpoVT family DNA-binding domain-containing protein [Nitrospirota bacterium]